MDSGLIGRPSIFRSQTCNKLDPSGFFVTYAEFSGGIFVDCSIHDIDLALWSSVFGPRLGAGFISLSQAKPGLILDWPVELKNAYQTVLEGGVG